MPFLSKTLTYGVFGPIILDYAPREFFCWHFYARRRGRILIMPDYLFKYKKYRTFLEFLWSLCPSPKCTASVLCSFALVFFATKACPGNSHHWVRDAINARLILRLRTLSQVQSNHTLEACEACLDLQVEALLRHIQYQKVDLKAVPRAPDRVTLKRSTFLCQILPFLYIHTLVCGCWIHKLILKHCPFLNKSKVLFKVNLVFLWQPWLWRNYLEFQFGSWRWTSLGIGIKNWFYGLPVK